MSLNLSVQEYKFRLSSFDGQFWLISVFSIKPILVERKPNGLRIYFKRESLLNICRHLIKTRGNGKERIYCGGYGLLNVLYNAHIPNTSPLYYYLLGKLKSFTLSNKSFEYPNA